MKKILNNMLKSVLTVFLACLMVVGVGSINVNEVKAEGDYTVEFVYGNGKFSNLTKGTGSLTSAVSNGFEDNGYSIIGTTSGYNNDTGDNLYGFNRQDLVTSIDFYYNDSVTTLTSNAINDSVSGYKGWVYVDTNGNVQYKFSGATSPSKANFKTNCPDGDRIILVFTATGSAQGVINSRWYLIDGNIKLVYHYKDELTVSFNKDTVANVALNNYVLTTDANGSRFNIPTTYSESDGQKAITASLTPATFTNGVGSLEVMVDTNTFSIDSLDKTYFLNGSTLTEREIYESGDVFKYSNNTLTFYNITKNINVSYVEKSDVTYTVSYKGCDVYGLTNPDDSIRNPGQNAIDVNPIGNKQYIDYDSKHYKFVGWYDETLETPYDFTQGLSSDVDLYAKFEEIYLISFTNASSISGTDKSGLHFDTDNKVIIVPTTANIAYGEGSAAGIAASAYVESSFIGNVSKVNVKFGEKEIELNYNNFAQNLHNTAYMFLDGTFTVGDKDDFAPEHTNNLLKFAKQSTETKQNLHSFRFYNIPCDIEITFTKNVQVSLQKSNADTPYVTFAVEENTTIDSSLLTEPQLEGVERRKGTAWYTDSACTQEFDFTNPITSNLTLYAQITRPYTITVINGGVGSTKPMTSSKVAGIATFNDAGNVLTFSEQYHNTDGIGVSVNAPALGNGNKIAFTYKGVTSYLTSGTNPIVVSAGRYIKDNGSISSSLTASTDCLKYVHTSATTTLYSIRIYNLTDDLVITFMPDTKSTVKFFDGDTELTDLEIDNVSWNNKITAPEYNPTEIPEGKSFIGWFDGDGNRFNFDSTVLSDVTLYAAYGDNRTVTFINASAVSNEWVGRTGGVINTEEGIFTVAGDFVSPEGTEDKTTNGVGANLTLSSTDVKNITFHVDGIENDIVFDSDKMPMNVTKTFYVGSDGTIKNQYVDPNAETKVSNFDYTDIFKIVHNADSKTVSLRFWNITSDITCTVNYKGITLTFVNGDDVQTINDIQYGTVLSGEQLPVDPEENFRGWITPTYSATGIISKCEEFDPTAPVTANARYYAQFNDVQYTVTIHHSHDGYQSAPIGEKFRNIVIPGTVHDGNQDFVASIYKGFALNGTDSANEDGLIINNRYQQQNKTDTVNSLIVTLGGGSEFTIPVNGAAATRYFVKDCEGNFVVRENPIVSGTPEEIDTVLAKIACDGTYGISFRIYDMECNIDLFVDYIKGSVTEMKTGMTNENNSTLSLNYAITLPDNVEKSDCVVVTGDKTIDLSDIAEDEDGNLIINVYNLPAKNMTDTFEITLMAYDAVASLEAGEDVYKPVTNPIVMSAKKYLNGVIDSTNPDISTEVKAFAEDMLHFGSYSQLYFNNTEGGLANEGHTAPTERLSTVTADSNNDLFVMEDVDDSVHFYGISLTLESETLMNTAFYFDDDIENYEVQVDGSKVEPDSSRGGKVNGKQIYYYTVSEGAAAPDLDEIHQFDVLHNGEIAYSVYWSPLSYANRAMNAYEGNPAKENLLNLVKMMYLYNESAELALEK